MILPILDYCCPVFQGCGKENEESLEKMVTSFYWDNLTRRRENQSLNWLNVSHRELPQAISPNIFCSRSNII